MTRIAQEAFVDADQENPPESRLRRLFGRYAEFAEAMETQPIDILERRVADIERRIARIENHSASGDTAKEI